MLKRISSSPVFFYSPPTSSTNNVLCIDRSPYYPKTTLEFFFITFRLLKVTRLGLSPAHHATNFRFFRAFSQVTLRKISRMTTNTNRRAIVFRAPLLPHLFENWRETNANARRRRMPVVALNKQKFYWRMRSEMPLCSDLLIPDSF